MSGKRIVFSSSEHRDHYCAEFLTLYFGRFVVGIYLEDAVKAFNRFLVKSEPLETDPFAMPGLDRMGIPADHFVVTIHELEDFNIGVGGNSLEEIKQLHQ